MRNVEMRLVRAWAGGRIRLTAWWAADTVRALHRAQRVRGEHPVRRVIIAAGAAIAAAAILVVGAMAQQTTTDDVRAQFAGLSPSDAEVVGYEVEEPVACLNAGLLLPPAVREQMGLPASAGMGIHYLNFALIDPVLDPLTPEVVVFGADGTLWSVEYLSPVPAQIFGQDLALVEEIGLYALHVWMLSNPRGEFADFNPDVDCGALAPPAAAVQPPDTGSAGLASSAGGPAGLVALAVLMALALAGVGARVLVRQRRP